MPKDFEDCVSKVKAQLIKDKGMSEDEASSSAHAICTAQFKKAGKSFKESEEKLDIDGHIIVDENVKLIIGANIIKVEEDLEEAVWPTSLRNNFPDSSFAYILPGGKKDAEGKTTPRSLRKLPYKDGAGKIDLPHVRNALARLSQTQGIPASAKDRIRIMLENILKKERGEE